jgi:hypothetical protein
MSTAQTDRVVNDLVDVDFDTVAAAGPAALGAGCRSSEPLPQPRSSTRLPGGIRSSTF